MSVVYMCSEHTLRGLLAVSQTHQTHMLLFGDISLSVPSPGMLFPMCLHGSLCSLLLREAFPGPSPKAEGLPSLPAPCCVSMRHRNDSLPLPAIFYY